MIRFRGFTLIELMVAVAIFAVLSALGWKVFDHVIQVKERNTQHEQRLDTLQSAYQQLLRDSVHIVPVNASQDGEQEAAFILENLYMRFSKVGVSDPLEQGLAPHERIEYRFDPEAQIVYRDKYPAIHQTGQLKPISNQILDHVSTFEVAALNPEPTARWPLENMDAQDENQLRQLPQGILIKFNYQGEEYTWLYSLLANENENLPSASVNINDPVSGDL